MKKTEEQIQEIQTFNKIKEYSYNKLGIPLKKTINTLVIISGLLIFLNLVFIIYKFFMKKNKVSAIILFLLYGLLLYCVIESSIKLKNINKINNEIKTNINNIDLNEYNSLLEFISVYSNVYNVRKNVIIILFVYIIIAPLIFIKLNI